MGFSGGGKWIEPMLSYTASDLSGGATVNDDPGRVRPGANVAGASFHSYLTYTAEWGRLTDAERDRLPLPFRRVGKEKPSCEGYLARDLTYSAGGRSLERSSLRSVA